MGKIVFEVVRYSAGTRLDMPEMYLNGQRTDLITMIGMLVDAVNELNQDPPTPTSNKEGT
jgi:hypothetical protein